MYVNCSIQISKKNIICLSHAFFLFCSFLQTNKFDSKKEQNILWWLNQYYWSPKAQSTLIESFGNEMLGVKRLVTVLPKGVTAR